jgi:hypothetical protein
MRGILVEQDEQALKNFKTVAHSPEVDSKPCDAFEGNFFILTAKLTANRINSGTFQYMMANW